MKRVKSELPAPGTQFGRWTTLDKFQAAKKGSKSGPKVLCECSCFRKTQRYVRLTVLRHGHSQSCGCSTREQQGEIAQASPGRKAGFINPPRPGTQFKSWTVIGGVKKVDPNNPRPSWLTQCQCVCGKKRWTSMSGLESGRTSGCGCLQSREAFAAKEDPYDARDTVVEMVRWLMDGGYRFSDRDNVERGIDRKWDDQAYWIDRANWKLETVIEELMA